MSLFLLLKLDQLRAAPAPLLVPSSCLECSPPRSLPGGPLAGHFSFLNQRLAVPDNLLTSSKAACPLSPDSYFLRVHLTPSGTALFTSLLFSSPGCSALLSSVPWQLRRGLIYCHLPTPRMVLVCSRRPIDVSEQMSGATEGSRAVPGARPPGTVQ